MYVYILSIDIHQDDEMNEYNSAFKKFKSKMF